jgi:hypothetical protein
VKRLAYAAALAAGVFATSACASGGPHPASTAARSIPVPVISEYSIHVGQTQTFGHVRPGDTVSCLGRADTISLKVPQRSVGTTYSVTWDKKLSLKLDPASHGRHTAKCRAR